MAKLFDRVKYNVAGAPNQATCTVGTRASANFYLPAEVGAGGFSIYYLLLNASNDEEHGIGTVASDGSTVTRDFVISSIISSTPGNTKINAGASSVMGFTSAADAFKSLRGSRTVTGATDTFLDLDGASVITYNRATAIAATLPQAANAGLFKDSWYSYVKNVGVGDVTITPTTSTISGDTSLVLKTAQGAFIWSDGTNYHHFILRGNNAEITVKSASATAFVVGLNGATNPAFQVDASTASSATGIKIKSAAAAGGVAVAVISSGTNESVTFDAKGSGTFTIQGTATGVISLARNTSVTGTLAVSSAISASNISVAVGSTDPYASTWGPSFHIGTNKNLVLRADVSTEVYVQALNDSSAGAPLTLAGSAIKLSAPTSIPDTTVSTSTTTGAVTIAGGLGVVGASYFGGIVSTIGSTAAFLAFDRTSVADNHWLMYAGGGNTFRIYNTNDNTDWLTVTKGTGVANVSAATATPAGGSTSARLIFGTTAGFGIYYGSGAPTVSAAQGSIYIRSDGSSTATRLYVNTNGSTGWTNFTSAA